MGKFVEALFVLELSGGVEGNLEVTTRDGEAKSLLQVLLEEKGDFRVSLLLEVAHDRVAAEVAFAENFFHLEQVLLLKGHLKQVVGVVDLLNLQLPLSRECVHLVLHEK